MVSGIAFTIAFLCLFEASLFKKDFFSPVRVYVFTQTITLGVAYLKLYPLMTDLKILTWAVFLGGMLSFVLGCYAMKLVFSANVKSLTSNNKFAYFENYRWNWHIFFAFLLFLTTLLPVKRFMDFTGGFPLFSSKLALLASQKLDSIGGWLIYPMMYSFFVIALFGVASFSSVNPHKRLRYFSRFMVIMQSLVLVLFFPSRGLIFMSIMFLVITWTHLKKTISSKILLFGIVFLLGIFVAIAYARDQYGSGSIQNFTLDKVIKIPYYYVANNYWNLDYALNPELPSVEHSTTYGLDHFLAPMPFIGSSLRKSFGWDNAFNNSITKEHGYNSVNYLWEVYKDFGGVGVGFIPFIWGIITTWLYMRLKNNLQLRILLLYAFAMIMISLWSFNIVYKSNPVYGFCILVIFGITEFCQKKKSVKNAP